MSAFSKLLPLDHPARIFYHYLRGVAAHWCYGRPGRDMIVIGITGTKGKTTTTNLIARGLAASGKRVFAFSTANYCLDGVWHENTTKMTSPSPFVLQRLLRQAEHAGCTHAVIETSSHSIFYNRDYGIAYDTVVFTNLSRDHLDLHRTMANYLATKKRLFERLVYYRRKKGVKKIGIVNLDDPAGSEFLSVTADALITYGVTPAAEISAKSVQETAEETLITVRMPSNEFVIRSKLRGAYNVSNVLAATAALVAQKVPSNTIAEALSSVSGIPGRPTGGKRPGDPDIRGLRAHRGVARKRAHNAPKPPGSQADHRGIRGDRRPRRREAPEDGSGGGQARGRGDRDGRRSLYRAERQDHHRGGGGHPPQARRGFLDRAKS
jgi:UDP-N-acetylmuramyl tripeptide synthase